MPSDVETARQVIECHRAYACQENALEHALEQLESIPIETIRMGNGVINRLTLLIEHDVRKVVILIYDQVERTSQFLRHVIQQVEFRRRLIEAQQLLHLVSGIIRPISIDEIIQTLAAIGVEVLL